jgi:N-acetylglucosaminylphosphatidylinositol deacetylase
MGLNPTSQVFILDEPNLPDGPSEHWGADVIEQKIEEHIKRHAVDIIITFDSLGVSGHRNHCDTGLGIFSLEQRASYKSWKTKVLYLETTNIFRKYCGVFDVIYSLCMNWKKWVSSNGVGGGGGGGDGGRLVVINTPSNVIRTIRALAAHWSQLVWYRLLFVVFSRYTYVNSLSSICIQKFHNR